MPQVLDYYGIERNRANRIRCVLHNGQDFNCGIKDHYIHCFVCGQSADVIKFVQVYFGLDFQSAISKLNDDFCLGLPIGQKIDRRKQLEMGRIAFERKRKAEQQQKERQQIEDDYWAAFDEWKRLDDNKRNYAPKTPTEHVCKCGDKFVTIEAFNALQGKFEELTARFEEITSNTTAKPKKSKETVDNE